MQQLIEQWTKYLHETWGLDSDFAEKAAGLIIVCAYYGLRPVITSGYRSEDLQAELVRQWKAGNPNIHTPLPAGKSLHNNTTWWGTAAALAMDMVVSNPSKAGAIASRLGLVWAGKSDPVHFAVRGGIL